MFSKKKSIGNECEICKIINQKNEAFKIYENDYAISFLEQQPISNGHVIVASKKHYRDLVSADEITIKALFSLAKYTSNKIAMNINTINNFYFLFNEKSISSQKYNHFYINIIPQYSDKNIVCKKENKWVDDVDTIYENIMKK